MGEGGCICWRQVIGVHACHKLGRVKVVDGLAWALGDVVGEDGLYTVGNVDKGELLNWSLSVGIGGVLADHVVGKRQEKD